MVLGLKVTHPLPSLSQPQGWVSEARGSEVKKKGQGGTSLVVRWLRIYLAMWGDTGSIPGWGTKISHALEPLSLWATTEESASLKCAAKKEPA